MSAKAAEKPHEVEKVPETAKAPPLPTATEGSPKSAMTTYIADFESDSTTGFEDVVAGDLVLPFWKLLQSLSPETRRAEPEFVKGAAEGMWIDSISKRLFKDITVVPCKMVTHYIEWNKRTAGGGLVRNWGTDRLVLDTCHRDDKTGRDVTPNDTEIVATATWFCLVIAGKEINPTINEDEGTDVDLLSRAVITFSATSLRASRLWVSQAQALRLKGRNGTPYQPPMFAMSYLLNCTSTRNDQGSWVLPVVKAAGWTSDYDRASLIIKEAREYADLAKELHLSIISSPHEPEVPKASRGNDRGGRSNDRAPVDGKKYDNAALDEDIPF